MQQQIPRAPPAGVLGPTQMRTVLELLRAGQQAELGRMAADMERHSH